VDGLADGIDVEVVKDLLFAFPVGVLVTLL